MLRTNKHAGGGADGSPLAPNAVTEESCFWQHAQARQC